MKLLAAFIVFFSINCTFADDNLIEMEQILKQARTNRCIPKVNPRTNQVDSYDYQNNDGKELNIENIGTVKSVRFEKTNSLQIPTQITSEIKYCLSMIYTKQREYFSKNNTYGDIMNDLNINQIKQCKSLNVSTEYMTNSEFKVTAQADQQEWSINQDKLLVQIR